MKKAQQGFTLIELMISVAIVGILASVAVPQYQAYTQKSRAAEMVTVAQQFAKSAAIAVQAGEVANTSLAFGSNGIATQAVMEAGDAVSTAALSAGVLTLTGDANKVGSDNVLTVTVGSDGTSTFGGSCVTGGTCSGL